MAVKAVFVGINKHFNPLIPELSGARRDATALWALFTDTIEGLSARLLLDEAATHDEMSRAILGVLDALDDNRLCDCVGAATATLLRPRREVVSGVWGGTEVNLSSN